MGGLLLGDDVGNEPVPRFVIEVVHQRVERTIQRGDGPTALR
jgi:hypothetical protein